VPDYRRRLRAPSYARLLGKARRERCFEPAFFEILEQRVAELEKAPSALARLLVHVRFQAETLLLALQSLGLGVAASEPRAPRALGAPLLGSDLRVALRSLLRSPGFTAVVAITLALGIGANVAIFSVVEAVLLRSLPFPEPERLVVGLATEPKQNRDRSAFSIPAVAEFRQASRSFEGLVGLSPQWSLTLRGGAEPERVFGMFASAGVFETLGVTPLLGRTFLPSEDRAGAPAVAVLSYGLWQRRFAGDPAIVGTSIQLDAGPATVVGVLPPRFRWAEAADIWVPLQQNPFLARGRVTRLVTFLGRLREGVTAPEAEREMTRIAAQLGAQYPATDAGLGARVIPLRDEWLGQARRPLLALLAAVALVLLIACFNVANLMLARATARRRLLAIRAALGAGRARLLREQLAESTLLALLGGALGVILALWGVRALVPLLPAALPRREDIAVDGSVLLFACAVSLLSGSVLGLLPALEITRRDLSGALKEAARGAGPVERHPLRNALVIAQVAVALVVVVASALLGRSFARLQGVDPGIRVENAVSMELSSLPGDAGARGALMEELYRRLSALPGVVAAGDVTRLPLAGIAGNPAANFVVEGRSYQPGEEPQIDFRRASRDYFRAVGIPLVSGRLFAESDAPGATSVMLINRAAVERFFPGEDPVGRRVTVVGNAYTIVGVVGDIRHVGLHVAPRPEAYIHTLQSPPNSPQLVVRTSLEPRAAIPAIRRVIRELDEALVIARLMTLEEVRSASLATPRFNTVLFGIFAALALALGLVGIYGVMAFTVAQRVPEMGIRLALGATRGQMLGLVLRHALRLAGVGIGVGLLASLGATRLLQDLLFEISPRDPLAFSAVALAMVAVTLLAASLPAARAARVDPLTALRDE
jgi:putative ABC transport system permease protein